MPEQTGASNPMEASAKGTLWRIRFSLVPGFVDLVGLPLMTVANIPEKGIVARVKNGWGIEALQLLVALGDGSTEVGVEPRPSDFDEEQFPPALGESLVEDRRNGTTSTYQELLRAHQELVREWDTPSAILVRGTTWVMRASARANLAGYCNRMFQTLWSSSEKEKLVIVRQLAEPSWPHLLLPFDQFSRCLVSPSAPSGFKDVLYSWTPVYDVQNRRMSTAGEYVHDLPPSALAVQFGG